VSTDEPRYVSPHLRVRCERGSLFVEDLVAGRSEAFPVEDLVRASCIEEITPDGAVGVVRIETRSRPPVAFGPLPIDDAEALLSAVRRVVARVREEERVRVLQERHDADPKQLFRRGMFRIVDEGEALHIDHNDSGPWLDICEVRSVEAHGDRVIVQRYDERVRLGPFTPADRDIVLGIFQSWMQRERLDDTLYDVTEADLRANPARFHKHRVRFTGTWKFGFECSDLAGAWVEVRKDCKPRFLDEHRYSTRRVTVEGRWMSKRDGRYGHMGVSPSKIIVDVLEDLGP
jgi:hypothetical protein